jgi:phenylacetate-CoA ligase
MERVTGRVADFLKKKDGTLVAGISLIERTLTKIPGLKQMQIVQERIDEIVVNCVYEERPQTRDNRLQTADHRPETEDHRPQTADKRPETTDLGQSVERLLLAEFKEVFGDISIVINPVDAIRQEANGKYRFSICRV